MEKANKTGKIVGALLLGAAIGGTIGAALGILFAPERGIDMRKKLKAKGDDLAGALKGKFNEVVEVAKREVGNVKDKASEIVENGGFVKPDRLK
jgi:gas vesicle protein